MVDPADFAPAIDIIAAVRDAVRPTVDILVEGHNRFSVHIALRQLERWLLNTGKPHLKDDTFQLVARELPQ